MKINDNRTIQQIVDEFRAKFPNLKLEFYTTEHDTGEGSSPREQYRHKVKLAEIRSIHDQGEITINKDMTVEELEADFSKKFGLNLQVFRRSGEIWLQTISTDNWTLGQQDSKGLESRKSD